MVKEVCSQKSGFGVCMLKNTPSADEAQSFYPVGTLVKVIDFSLLDDGLLGIEVEGIACFKVKSVQSQHDGLLVGECEQTQIWPEAHQPKDMSLIRENLLQIHTVYPELKLSDDVKNLSDPNWLMMRWLEILPISAAEKQQFLQQESGEALENYLTKLII
jgi:Lon protease-like protein